MNNSVVVVDRGNQWKDIRSAFNHVILFREWLETRQRTLTSNILDEGLASRLEREVFKIMRTITQGF